ncbi:GNAT family N-acetyltransferase [Yoonia sediminilitoris]|uniref:Acetyltransferase (GNAT) family protein n=1 Tax=Yoonia sediminilitoris TaxID=1286148 RepID=A0A2T6K7N4_9RHOB|nr:GNAT family N-acetyltransferase [Yoonia sediminilitoris]PUB10725.1 acetyltransferase (GNAT) family protein [Yoonia sediminilitoris]RCW90477.1 acetyltransferase (GNAT) family protein [Yoonia sediminilitoris]
MRNYEFRTLTKQDLPQLGSWLQLPHVKVWWGDAEQQVALIEKDMNNTAVDMLIVALSGRPFAYIRHHDAHLFQMPEYGDLPVGTRVIATFVGDPDFLGQGHAVGYIETFIRDLRLHYPLVAVAAGTTDTRMIGVYSQAGFHKRRFAPTSDGRLVQVMTHH